LFDGGGAEGVASGQQRFGPLLLDMVSPLGTGRGFAGAIDPDERGHDESRWRLAKRRLGIRQAIFHFLSRDGKHIQSGATLRFIGLFHGDRNLQRYGHAKIGADQGCLQFLQRRAGQLGRTGKDAFKFMRQFGMGFLETFFEFLKQTHE
jgi:hypothetical protein